MQRAKQISLMLLHSLSNSHILNHDVLFGGGYVNQARGMIDRIMKF